MFFEEFRDRGLKLRRLRSMTPPDQIAVRLGIPQGTDQGRGNMVSIRSRQRPA